MTTRELIKQEIDNVGEENLDELYAVVKTFSQSVQQANGQSFMAKLRQIQIDAPEDFWDNFDFYASGEKRVE
jgi:hypothetical protein